MKTVMKVITPEIAKELLRGNVNNRALSKTVVKKLVNDIKNGKFQTTHQGIAISTDHKILDGQHRLTAITIAGKSVNMLVSYDVDPEMFKFIDLGKRRTGADAFSVKKIPNYTTAAGAIQMLRTLEVGFHHFGGTVPDYRLDNDDLLNRYYQLQQETDDAVILAKKLYTCYRIIPPSNIAALKLYLDLYVEPNMEALTRDFMFQIFNQKSGNSKSNAPSKLFEKLVNQKIEKQIGSRAIAAYIVKAWNAFILGKNISILRYQPNNENFPEFVSIP